MLNFKKFLENEWLIDYEDEPGLLDNIYLSNSEIPDERLWQLPDYMDPDVFYNIGAVFTFSYSERKENGKTEGLKVTTPYTMHRNYIKPIYKDNSPIITGRYGIYKKNVPIVTIWTDKYPSLNRDCLKELWSKNLIHKQSYLYIQENLGKVHDFIFSKVPAKFKQEAGQEVELPSGKYLLRELPALLHTLPSSSDKHKEICQFICKNHDKYPILKNFLSKASCTQITQQPKTTLQQRMLQFTSENANI